MESELNKEINEHIKKKLLPLLSKYSPSSNRKNEQGFVTVQFQLDNGIKVSIAPMEHYYDNMKNWTTYNIMFVENGEKEYEESDQIEVGKQKTEKDVLEMIEEKGDKMSKELKFASANQALQHLADITGKRIKVAGYENSMEVSLADTDEEERKYKLTLKIIKKGLFEASADVEVYKDGDIDNWSWESNVVDYSINNKNPAIVEVTIKPLNGDKILEEDYHDLIYHMEDLVSQEEVTDRWQKYYYVNDLFEDIEEVNIDGETSSHYQEAASVFEDARASLDVKNAKKIDDKTFRFEVFV